MKIAFLVFLWALLLTSLVQLTRALFFVLKGYRRQSVLKLTLLLFGLGLFEAWFRFSSGLQWIHLTCFWAPFVMLGVALLYTLVTDRRHPDRWNSFALAALGALIGAMMLGVRACQVELAPVYSISEAGGLLKAAVLGGCAVFLGLVALVTIGMGRCGTRGRLLAVAVIVIPLCWIYICWSLLFRSCPPVHPSVSLFEGSLSCREARYDHMETGIVPRVVITATGSYELPRDKEGPVPLVDVHEYLRQSSAQMLKAPESALEEARLIPNDPVLVLPDENSMFSAILKLSEVCAQPDVEIWKVHLGINYPESHCVCVLRTVSHSIMPHLRVRVQFSDEALAEGRYWLNGQEMEDVNAATDEVARFCASLTEFPARVAWIVEGNPTWGQVASGLHRFLDRNDDYVQVHLRRE